VKGNTFESLVGAMLLTRYGVDVKDDKGLFASPQQAFLLFERNCF